MVPSRDMPNWLYSASEALRTSKMILEMVGDSRIVLSDEELLVPGVLNAVLLNV